MKTSVLRGTYEEKVAHHDGVDFSASVWKDNKVVTLLSTYVGAEPAGKVQRFDKKLKQKIDVPCPKVVQEYNMHMGGVDLMDSYLGRYRIRVKSKKWYMRLFYHLLDLAVINSWVLYKKNMTAKGTPKKLLPNLGEFRNELADVLCNVGISNDNKRGRPSNSSLEEQAKKQRGPAHPLPCKDVRLDAKIYEENGFANYPEDIFNMDESGIQVNNKPGRIIATKGAKDVYTLISSEMGENVTVIACCNAQGSEDIDGQEQREEVDTL
ncbi:hypothetical protein PYW07_006689 [Mythimna separata]|uniref:PiggyBac transposable element-derived protein domain-containing protein n=1 Tax=Mythimna separata TaxID=271217 RepID=A0AAD7YVT8_MYTSE|nr:hypothetical protein PYW07_006689 [Mythimna separata]